MAGEETGQAKKQRRVRKEAAPLAENATPHIAASQADVALRAGVSSSAVSLVLNGKGDTHRISADTVRRVRQAAEELGYRPNAVARSLRNRRTNTVGVVLGSSEVSYLNHPYFGPALQGIVQTTFEANQFVMLYHGGSLAKKNFDISLYTDGRCDGLILVPPFTTDWVVDALLRRGFPFVTLGDAVSDPRIPCADVDNITGMRSVADALLGLGHRHVFGLGRNGYSDSTKSRLALLAKALAAGGCRFTQANARSGQPDAIRAALRPVFVGLSPESRPTALFCLTDELALPALEILAEFGLRAPESLSVVGFDDAPAAQAAGLTTVRQDSFQIGSAAARILLNRTMAGMSNPAEKASIAPVFVARASIGPPPR